MRSRAAIAKGRRQSATAVAREGAAVAKAIPATLLGAQTLAALKDIERRIARFLAGETR